MRFPLVLSLFTSLAAAQYVNQGWKPGQPRQQNMQQYGEFDPANPRKPAHQRAPAATPAPQETKPASYDPTTKRSFWVDLFSTGPIGDAVKKAGINVTRVVERQHVDEAWDKRIPLIYDESYNDTIVNEVLTPKEEESRVWFVVVSGGPQGTAISKWVDTQFDMAFNETQIAGSLPHVRWGRINYNDVTYITTKWVIWKAPVILLFRNRGKEIRFYYPQTLSMRAESLQKFLEIEAWKEQEAWFGPYAPGGESEWIMDKFASYMTTFYNFLERTPKFVMLMVTGALTSFVLNILHSSNKSANKAKKEADAAKAAKVAAAGTATAPATTTTIPPASPASNGAAKKRNNRKK